MIVRTIRRSKKPRIRAQMVWNLGAAPFGCKGAVF